jgi:hypothetical protein
LRRCMLSRCRAPLLLGLWAVGCSCEPCTASFLDWWLFSMGLLLDWWVCCCNVHLALDFALRRRRCLTLWFLRGAGSVNLHHCQRASSRWTSLSLSFTFRNSKLLKSFPSPVFQWTAGKRSSQRWLIKMLYLPFLFLSQYFWDR